MDVHFRLKSSPSPIVRLLAVGRNDLWLLRSPRPLARAGQVGDLPYSLSTYR